MMEHFELNIASVPFSHNELFSQKHTDIATVDNMCLSTVTRILCTSQKNINFKLVITITIFILLIMRLFVNVMLTLF